MAGRSVRSVYRTGILVFLLVLARLDGWMRKAFFGMTPGPEGAVWVHGWCRRIVETLGLKYAVEGRVPEPRPGGLPLVSNPRNI